MIEKILKKSLKFLFKFSFKLLLMAAMILSAHKVIDLPFGWECFGYILLFAFGLTVWSNLYAYEKAQTKQTLNESYNNSCFIMKASNGLLLVDRNYVFAYVQYKSDGKKPFGCPYSFEEGGYFVEVRDLIDKQIEDKKD